MHRMHKAISEEHIPFYFSLDKRLTTGMNAVQN
jgi:hypothetical protein